MTTRQVLSFSDLQRILYDDISKRRINSVATPPAPTTTPLQVSSDQESAFSATIGNILGNSALPIFLRAVIELQYNYGLRISEVLNIQSNDVKRSGHIVIKGSKGSSNRIVLPSIFSDFWLFSGKHLLPLINIYSRFYFYRHYKNLGLYAKFGSNSVNSVTHLFRHNVISNLNSDTIDIDTVRSFIGHKNVNNTLLYANKKRK